MVKHSKINIKNVKSCVGPFLLAVMFTLPVFTASYVLKKFQINSPLTIAKYSKLNL